MLRDKLKILWPDRSRSCVLLIQKQILTSSYVSRLVEFPTLMSRLALPDALTADYSRQSQSVVSEDQQSQTIHWDWGGITAISLNTANNPEVPKSK